MRDPLDPLVNPQEGDVVRSRNGIEMRCKAVRNFKAHGITAQYQNFNYQYTVQTSRKWWREAAKGGEVIHVAS